MYRLLIVEDESWIRMGLECIMDWKALGVELIPSAANGKEALERVREQTPDIVLTDIRMPEMDGLELMRRLRQAHPQIKLIVISGFGDFSYAQQAIRYGAFSYVLKPIDENTLEAEIRRCIWEIAARDSARISAESGTTDNAKKLRSWLEGHAPHADAAREGPRLVRVALLHIEWAKDSPFDDVLARTMHKLLDRYITGMMGKLIAASAEMDEGLAYLLDADDDRRLHEMLDRLNVVGISDLGFSVLLGISEPVDRQADGTQVYRQVCACLDEMLETDRQANPRSIVAEASEYINANIADPKLSLSSISAALHINHSYLSHAFRVDTGTNVTNYIMQKRVELAVRQMQDTRKSLEQIAQQVGYPNIQYFIRVFKKMVSVTPAQYRKNIKKQK